MKKIQFYTSSTIILKQAVRSNSNISTDDNGALVSSSSIEKETIINDILIKMKKMNYIDDNRYSNLKSEKMFNNGTSKKMIKVKLKEKGIPDDIINNSLDTLLENNKNDFSSALIYIKKRKIGIFYQKRFNKKDNDLLKHKWYGTLARKGFSYDIVKKVLELDDLTEAENIINRIKF
mgnify:CR=1 FL=1